MTQVLDRPTGTEAATASAPAPLNRYTDRCDAQVVKMVDGVKQRGTCGAEAFFRAVHTETGFDLLFCGHCLGSQPGGTEGARNRTRREHLERQGFVIHSEYERINLKPTAPNPDNGF